MEEFFLPVRGVMGVMEVMEAMGAMGVMRVMRVMGFQISDIRFAIEQEGCRKVQEELRFEIFFAFEEHC